MKINKTIDTITHKIGFIETQESIIKYIRNSKRLMNYMEFFSKNTLFEAMYQIENKKLFIETITPIANRRVRESLDSCLILAHRIKKEV